MADGTDTYDLFINQGATYSRIFVWYQGCGCVPVGSGPGGLPVNLTGYTASMQIRPYVLSTTVLYDATADITLGGVFGTITLTIDATDTETFTWFNGVYDLLMTSAGGQVTRLLMGSVEISPGVTQP
jgi:hypothetical protein